MHLMRLSCVAVVCLAAPACGPSPSSPGDAPPPKIEALPRPLSAGEQGLVNAIRAFAPALMARINEGRALDNIFLSPLSAAMALGMTMNGTAGTTYTEMQAALGFEGMTREQVIRSYRDLIDLLRGLDPKVDFRIANSIWYRDSFAPAISPAFLAESRDYFDASAGGLDFGSPSAVTTINNSVKAGTNGRIDSIVESIAPEIVMFLVNAIYFKGDWRDAFDKAKTAPAPFTTEAGTRVNVPMMHRAGAARVGRHDGRTIVELGYGGDAFSMAIVLPREGESVNGLVATLTPESWATAMASASPGEVDLSMPRFALTWEATLNDALQALGMRAAFNPGGADFTRLSPSMGRELYISVVRQKTFVDVNEVGTEAAAVTSVEIGVTSMPVRTVVRVDRPFVFAIRERLSGTILFMGKITSPPPS